MAKDYLITFLSTGSLGEMYANTICVHDDESGSARDEGDVVDEVDDWLTTKYRAICQTVTTLDALRCFRIPAVYGAETSVALKAKGVAGTMAAGDGKIPREMTLTLSLKSASTSRRQNGRISLPSPEGSAQVTNTGQWNTAGDYWVAAGVFGNALLAGHDVGALGIGGHLSTRIYSRRQHKIGSGDKTHDVDSFIRRSRPRWLRSRVTSP